MNNDAVKELVQWIAANADKEFMSSEWNVNAHALLEKVCELSGVDRDEVKKWVDEITDARLEERRKWREQIRTR